MSRRGLTLSNLLCPDRHARPRQAPRRGAHGSPRRPILGLAMHLRTLPVQQACPWLRGLSATPRGIQDGDKEGFFFLIRHMQCGQSTNVCSGPENETGNL